MKRPLSELASAIDLPAHPSWKGIYVTRVIEDSRRIEPGDLFVAIRGVKGDGHDYIGQAIARGAVAVVSERPCGPSVPELVVPDGRAALAILAAEMEGRPTEELFTVGVTGTNGKTTVAHLAAQVLGEGETELVSTVSNETRGIPGVTTPPAPIVQRIARRAVDAGKRNLVIEASSIGLDQRRLFGVGFDVAVFTNLTHDHLDYHRDMEGYLAAKLILFQGLREDAIALINTDDPASGRVASSTRARVITYGFDNEADLRPLDIEPSVRGTIFTLAAPEGSVCVRIHLPAEYNVANALAAAGIGLAKGLKLEEVGRRLGEARPAEGRCEIFRSGDGAEVIVDFAHSPDALERTLRFLKRNYPRVICVFGCPGESDRKKRPLMGRISGRLADLTILTTDNPKQEDPDRIIDEIEIGIIATPGRYERVVDRKEAIRRAIRSSREGDAVLIAGKGHETYQIVGERFVPYSDAAVLQGLGFTQVRGGNPLPPRTENEENEYG